MNDSFLSDLQNDLVGRGLADEFLGALGGVLDERKGNILDDIQTRMGLVNAGATGKLGACVILLAPVGTVEYVNAPGGPLTADVTFRVLEMPLYNMGETGTQKPALDICHRVVRVFQHYAPGGLASCLTAKKPTIVPYQDELAPVAYEVRFACLQANDDGFDKAATPVLSAEEGAAPLNVSISCATAGAAIYYTLDGSHPRSGNGTLYAGPVAVNAAATLRAAAYKAGIIASDVACGIYT